MSAPHCVSAARARCVRSALPYSRGALLRQRRPGHTGVQVRQPGYFCVDSENRVPATVPMQRAHQAWQYTASQSLFSLRVAPEAGHDRSNSKRCSQLRTSQPTRLQIHRVGSAARARQAAKDGPQPHSRGRVPRCVALAGREQPAAPAEQVSRGEGPDQRAGARPGAVSAERADAGRLAAAHHGTARCRRAIHLCSGCAIRCATAMPRAGSFANATCDCLCASSLSRRVRLVRSP